MPSPGRVLGVLGGGASTDIAADASGRLELAAWLTRRDNPLTARVMVNRIWHHLFGAGLVRTVDNFGHSGERPSHPELLDHLAVEFMNGGWSVKRAIRTLVLSRVYGLASGHDDGNHAVDPDTRFLWRMSQRRLDVESLRDAMLAASGRLDLARPSGSVVMAFRMGELGRGRGTGPADEPVEHRSVYLPILRGIVPDILETFDFADPSMVKGRRDVTTVATQALYLMNSPFVLSRSQQFARRLLERDGLDDGERLDLAYRLALGRAPPPAERARALDYLRGRRRAGGADGGETATGGERLAAWSGFCQALFACAEFRYVD